MIVNVDYVLANYVELMPSIPSTAAIAEQLARMDLFQGLKTLALTEVARRGQVQHLPKGTLLFPQGAPADRCHALIKGRMRIAPGR